MSRLLDEILYEYAEFNPTTGRGTILEHIYVEKTAIDDDEHVIVPVEEPKPRRARKPIMPAMPVPMPVPMPVAAPLPVAIPAPIIARAHVPAPAAPAQDLTCNDEDQFWNIIGQIKWDSSKNVSILRRLNAQGKVNFRRMYDQHINLLTPHAIRITHSDYEAIVLSSHFVGLGRNTYDGVKEDPTFIMILYEEHAYENFDSEVLRGLV
jgi:hypothetical protein